MAKSQIKEPFSAQLREWRLSIRNKDGESISQFQFARKLGIHPSTIWRWEHGRMKPSPITMKYLNQCGFYLKE